MKNAILTSGSAGWRRGLMFFMLACSLTACADDDADGKYGFHSRHHHGMYPPSWYKIPANQPVN